MAAPSSNLPIRGSKDPRFEHPLQKVRATDELFWLLLGDENDGCPKDGSRNKLAFWSLEL